MIPGDMVRNDGDLDEDTAPEQGDGLAHQLAEVARDAADEATELGERIVDAAAPIAEKVVRGGAAAGRLIVAAADRRPGQEGGRLRALAKRNREPLESLYELHPEARNAPRRDLGLLTIPVSRIRGTAVEGPAQRGGDFLPVKQLKSANWRSRWQRLRDAQNRLAILPPIDVLQTADGYWVVDGHNRVALALYGNQDDIDASVIHLHLPGESDAGVRAGSMESVLDEARQLRAAGQGRLSRGAAARSRAPRQPEDRTSEPEDRSSDPAGSPPPDEP